MTITADTNTHQVMIRTDSGSEIILSWAAAANLGSLLNEASRQAEPPAPQGRTYRPAVEQERR